MDRREEFRKAWEAWEAFRATTPFAEVDRLQKELNALLRERAGDLRSKRAKALDDSDSAAWLQKHHPGVMTEVCAPFQVKVEVLWAEHGETKRRLNAELDRLSPLCAVEAGDLWLPVVSHSSDEFRSQGFGNHHYAQVATRLLEAWARDQGGAEVRVVSDRGSATWSIHTLEARVREPLDVEILRRHEAPQLREQVRLCWSMGANPRVLWPTLSPDYEARSGLDYHGRDLWRERSDD